MSEPLLSVRNVALNFGGVQAVRDVSFDVLEGSITGLIGPNGAGKSSVLAIVSGFVAPKSGSVTFAGQLVSGQPPFRLARQGLVRTFQLSSEFERLSVIENLMVAAPHQSGERLRDALAGRWRLLELARALMAEPKLLLLDEPMAGVNPALIRRIESHLLALRDEGLTMLMIEHELGVVERLCDPVIVMAQGQVLSSGTMAELRTNQEVRDAYLVG